jgi:hypothetical protein
VRRRPQPNPLRGILRALGAAVGLIVIMLVAILVASSLTAPSVHAPAPTPPATPRALSTPTPAKTRTTKPVPTPTKKKGALDKPRSQKGPRGGLADSSDRKLVDRALLHIKGRHQNSTSLPGVTPIAFFKRTGGAYSANPLFVASSPSAQPRRVGFGDAFVNPVWSPGRRFLAYVRVSETSSFPGAHWSLIQLDIRSGHEEVAARDDALSLTPLGWSLGRLIYMVANSTDTSIYASIAGHAEFLGIMIAQPLVSASLSPDGRHIAFATPTSCAYCTVNEYELNEGSVWTGPTGMPNETTLTWTADGSALVALVGDHLRVLSEDDHASHEFAVPRGLPSRWEHPMQATISGDAIRLIDTVTGKSFQSDQG